MPVVTVTRICAQTVPASTSHPPHATTPIYQRDNTKSRVIIDDYMGLSIAVRFTNLLLPKLSQPSNSYPQGKAKVWNNHDRHGLSWFGLLW